MSAGGLSAELDIEMPARGIAWAATPTARPDRFLGVDLRSPCRTVDHWTRGVDTVAVYAPDDPRRLRASALWRPCPAPSAAVWEVIVSAQTDLEQSDASLAVVADLAADSILWGIEHDGSLAWRETPPADACAVRCLLARRPAAVAPTSALVAGYPGDVRRIAAQRRDGRVEVACWLFSSAAEKGVLFRGRVLTAIGPAAEDRAWAEAVLRWHAATPPVLTT
jgi:hypothetical protein